MKKLTGLKLTLLSAFAILLLFSFISIAGCGKKDESTTSGDKDKNESSSDDKKSSDDVSKDSPVHVVFEISGSMAGTVDAYYHNNKSKSTSTMTIAGQKMTASAYFDGG